MPESKHLLVATDFSPAAQRAVERGARLARAADARLSLVHVAIPGFIGRWRQIADPQPVGTETGGAALAQTTLKMESARLLARYGLAGEVEVASGSPAEEVVRCAEHRAADLIVVGDSADGAARHLLRASMAERLLAYTGCPLLVVKEDSASDYRSVLVAVDFSPASRDTLLAARRLAGDAALLVLHVYTAPFESKLRYAGIGASALRSSRRAARQQASQRLRALCRDAGLDDAAGTHRAVVVHGDAAHDILAQQRLHGCELIVVGRRGETALESLLLGSVTRHVLRRAPCDVLIC